MLLDGRLFELPGHGFDIGPDMNRLDRGELVEALGVASAFDLVSWSMPPPCFDSCLVL